MNKPDYSPIAVRLNRRFFLIAAGSFATSTLFASCAPSQDSASQNSASQDSANSSASPQANSSAVLKVGVNPVPHGEILKFVQDNLAAGAGLNIEIVEFTDYVQPNLALNDKQLDANYFQHVPYMEDFGKQRNIDMVFVKGVHVEPLGLYSKKIKSLSEVSSGAQIAVPNDATNLGRSLKLLQDNQLLQLKSSAGVAATTQDIQQNSKNLKLVELEAAQLPRSLDDTDLAIVNGNYALEVGLNPAKDSLALEKAEGNPYANGLVVLRERENDANIQELAKLLTSPEVKKFIDDKYQGAVIPAF